MNWYKLSKFETTDSSETYNIGPFHNLTLLGCGEAGGCAYLDPATGHAIKQTVSETEASRARALLEKDFSFFPHIYQVLPQKGNWIIEREEIPSLSSNDQDVLDTAQMALEEVDYDLDRFPQHLKITLEEFGMDPESDFMYAYSMGLKLVELIESVEAIGGLPGEIRGENIGIRNGEFVIRDVDV